MNYPRIIIAGVRGGSGKTTVSLSLTASLRSHCNLKVVPYKKGPDYIDAGWLSLAAKRPCYNLDPFLVAKDEVARSFVAHFEGDMAVIEGNRGLFDGMDVEGSFSTAELAKLLNAPVILVVDCTKMTRTSAAVIQGLMSFDKGLGIKGVVLNQLAGARHESIIRQSVEKYCSVAVVGAIPRLKAGEMPERHMGLTPYQEHENTTGVISFAKGLGEKYLDLTAIVAIAESAGPLTLIATTIDRDKSAASASVVRIGVFRDAAFQFYYPENFEELRRLGAEIVEIDAIDGGSLPEVDALYIGGGFPETNALKLAENTSFREHVKSAAEKGLPIYAECGGLMFLGDAIIMNGQRYPMAGVFPLVFDMKPKPQAHGYTIVDVVGENPFYPEGTVLHGHEFHYSSVVEIRDPEGYRLAFSMKRGKGIGEQADGICYKNVLATYTHVHALGTPGWARGLIDKAKEYKEKNDKIHA
ncbi:MAG TPA: cobyrinate a,c-diamide synthase [Dissulfurispiraceae bacterium]|nr:cobyrinate a,c-diamide synthase [Dissulfurispiraceae bacterium]